MPGCEFDRRRMTNMTCDEFDKALATEWAVISTGVVARKTLRRWATAEPLLVAFDTPDAVLQAILTTDLEESVAITQAVLRLARSDRLASRLLIQVMVPTLATECYRTLRTLRAEQVPVSSAEVVSLVVGAAAEVIGSYARRDSVPFPIRTIRRRMITLIVGRRAKMIERAQIEAVELVDGQGAAGRCDEEELSPAELLADTLTTAVDLGIVSGADARLVWLARRFDVPARVLAGNDSREHERLRRRRSRAQLRLVENRDALVEAGLAG